MAKIIINTDSISHTYAGQIITSGSSYTIQGNEQIAFANDDNLLSDIGSGKAKVNDGTSDVVGISNQINFLKDIDLIVRDADNRTAVRPVAAKSGWTFAAIPIEFKTAKYNSVVSLLQDNTNRSGITFKIYDDNNDEIISSENEANAVKTVIDFEPSYDYEIIGGSCQQHTKPTTDIRIWCIGVPDIASPTGSKEMLGGINLKFIDPSDKINADGRVSKYMSYNATYHTNKLRFIFKHDVGVQHDFMIVIELFRA